MPGTSDPYAAFRLNLEQQRKRAKDLLRAVRAGDASARRRLADDAAALALGGCNLKGGGEDLVNGKQLFVQECAACHVLDSAADPS